jgi:hypothetical protein
MKKIDLTEGLSEMLSDTRQHYEDLSGTCINCGESIDQCECGHFKSKINELIPEEN